MAEADGRGLGAGAQAALLDDPEFLRGLVQGALQAILEAEMEAHLGAGRYERAAARTGYRNGYKPRTLHTRVGSLELRVPQDRDGAFSTELFARYQRNEQALVLALMEMYVQGVSTRKVAAVTEQLCGTGFSKSQVSALAGRLDGELAAWRERPLPAAYPYLSVDARYGIADSPVFVIDQSRCIGCEACVQACEECGTHRGHSMIHLDFLDRGATTQSAPMICMHCDDPTCAEVCPADAIKQNESGVVQSALKPRCIGCSNCVLACPFGVPKYMSDFDLMMKCDLCLDRTSEGLAPMCASVCPSEALWYGTESEFVATRAGTLVDTFSFGQQIVTTRVRAVSRTDDPIEVEPRNSVQHWLDDPFGLENGSAR